MLNCSAETNGKLMIRPNARVNGMAVLRFTHLESSLWTENLISSPSNFDSRSYRIISRSILWKKLGGMGW
jgi:hypothetical protein